MSNQLVFLLPFGLRKKCQTMRTVPFPAIRYRANVGIRAFPINWGPDRKGTADQPETVDCRIPCRR